MLDILEAQPELLETCEVVYFAEVPDTVQKRLDNFAGKQADHGERLARLEGRLTVPVQGNWLQRNAYWVTPLIAIIGLILGTGFVTKHFTLVVDSEISAKLHDPISDISALQRDVAVVRKGQEDIQPLIKTIFENEAKRISALSIKDFEKGLPEVKTILDAALLGHVIPHATVVEIGAKLQQSNRDAPQFWSASSSLINYRSPDNPEKFQSCMAQAGDQRLVPLDEPFLKFDNCEIDLDAGVPIQIIMRVSRSHAPIVFSNCKVIYRGGDIVLIKPGSALIFINCVYDISVPKAPPRNGGDLITGILAAPDMKRIEIKGSGA